MERILLLEAEYKNKFPPIGLMKLATYHSRHRGDLVWFAKGRVDRELAPDKRERIKATPYYQKQYGATLDGYLNEVAEAIAGGKWDRVYVTTLFTFEWAKTIALIEYAKTLVDNPAKVFVGGIAATLMPDEIEKATGIKPMTGLLHDCRQIGYDDNVCIDTLIPDYSILGHVQYVYPAANSFFLTATRGCGMKCSFCAVQTLEPEYVDYIPIKPRIEAIRELYGDKRDLCLLDNNVLKSAKFSRIVDDIKEAGFYKGSVWINPKTGKPNIRRVDFNQGLDANFFTEAKAKLLSETALDPCHIAFDHIDDKEAYIRAAHIADKTNLRSVTSYLLYNTSAFKGKGKPKDADTPKDLYDRIYTTMQLDAEINVRRKAAGEPPFYTHSFPMRFAPLGCKTRKFVGDNWNKKLLNGVATVFQPSRGGAFSKKDYFEHMYGRSYEEFYRILIMPLMYVKHKGKPAHKYPAGQAPNIVWLEAARLWNQQYEALDDAERVVFEKAIADNEFTGDRFFVLRNDPKVWQLFIHYFDGVKLIKLLEHLNRLDTALYDWVRYFVLENPPILAANMELLGKHKQGEAEIELLLRTLFTPSLAQAG